MAMAIPPIQQRIPPDFIDIWSPFTAIAPHDELCTLSSDDFSTCLHCVSLLKDDILQSQTVPALPAPNHPPPSNAFFDHFFPVLGPSLALGALGIFQCLIGASVLSRRVNDFTLVSAFTLVFAFMLVVIGCINMFTGLCRQSIKDKRSITSWRSEFKPILPTFNLGRSDSAMSGASNSTVVEKGANEFGPHSVG